MKIYFRHRGCPSLLKVYFGLLASTHISTFLVSAIRSSCNSPGTFENETATVTCDFEKDIRNLGLDFELRHIPVTVSDTESEIVLSCYWEKRKPVCKGRPGYQLGSDVTRQFTVKIFAANSRHAGKYVCMLVPHDPGEYNYCQLVIKETTTQEITTNSNKAVSFDIDLQSRHIVFDSKFITLGNHFSTLRSPTSTSVSDILTNLEENKGTSNALLVFVIIPVVLVIGLMITVICRIRSRQGKHSKHPQNKNLLEGSADEAKDSSRNLSVLRKERNQLALARIEQPRNNITNTRLNMSEIDDTETVGLYSETCN